VPVKKTESQDPDVAQARAAEAKTLLDHPLIKEALDYFEDVCKDLFANSAPDEPQVRELVYQQLHAARMVRSYLTRVINKGKVAAHQTAAAEAANGGTGKSERRTH
jgi:hypothetical protein